MPTFGLDVDVQLEKWPTSGLMAILDLEYTAWEGSGSRKWSGPEEWREIVQMGVLIVDVKQGFREVLGMERMVCPKKNPQLSDYFVNLTGITQKIMEREAVSFATLFSDLVTFVKDAQFIIFNGSDGQVLRENCLLHEVDFRSLNKDMFNFRPLLSKVLGRPESTLVSSTLPDQAGVLLEGRGHSALHDCRAIAAALAKWRNSGVL